MNTLSIVSIIIVSIVFGVFLTAAIFWIGVMYADSNDKSKR
jgi:hypothetical protein